MNAICKLKVVSSLLGHFRTAKAPIVHVMQEDLPHVSFFALKQIQKKINRLLLLYLSLVSVHLFHHLHFFTNAFNSGKVKKEGIFGNFRIQEFPGCKFYFHILGAPGPLYYNAKMT